MRAAILATKLEEELRRALEALDLVSHIEIRRDLEVLAAEVAADDLGLIVVEAVDDTRHIAAVRAAFVNVPILGIVSAGAGSQALREGADDTLDIEGLTAGVLRQGVRHAAERRGDKRTEASLLEGLRYFGESLSEEMSLDAIIERVLDRVMSSTGATIGYLLCEWEWMGEVDRIAALHGAELSSDELEALGRHPGFSPLLLEEGRVSHGPESNILEPLLGPLESLAVLPVARWGTWGRGGIVIGHREVNAFSERDLKIASGLMGWAGVAIRQAAITRERNRAVQMRERILAVVSHDLRNPLSTFNMALELLQDTESIEERDAILERAKRAVGNMSRLIGDLLDHAALDAGTLRVETASSDPLVIASRALEAIDREAAKKTIDAGLGPVTGKLEAIEVDSDRLVQALTNLLTNAVKFTPRGGKVAVEVMQSPRTTTFVVSDTGPGVPNDLQQRLFDRYFTRDSGHRGVGLGLSIARGIAESHAGSLVIESSEGEGARFMLTVPNLAAPRTRST